MVYDTNPHEDSPPYNKQQPAVQQTTTRNPPYSKQQPAVPAYNKQQLTMVDLSEQQTTTHHGGLFRVQILQRHRLSSSVSQTEIMSRKVKK
jgi:hypothetical protein